MEEVIKRECTQCKKVLDYTLEFFPKRVTNKTGLDYKCRKCDSLNRSIRRTELRAKSNPKTKVSRKKKTESEYKYSLVDKNNKKVESSLISINMDRAIMVLKVNYPKHTKLDIY